MLQGKITKAEIAELIVGQGRISAHYVSKTPNAKQGLEETGSF